MSGRNVPKSRRLRLVHDDDVASIDGIADAPSAKKVAEALQSGLCPSDRSFDRFLPYDLRRVSGQHWTPLAVALRVAEWLDREGARTVVDVGSGAGKFCVAAALASRCTFVGVEQRPRFVEAARALAQSFGIADRVRFVHGVLGRCSLPPADAYYLYNPFGENLFGVDEFLDDEVVLGPERYKQDVALMESFFERARVGTLVIKYNGFGGRMPPCYERAAVDRELPNVLRMWRKRRSASTPPQRKTP